MGVPFESLLPYAIIITMFGLSGGAVSGLRYLQADKHRGRHGLDTWDIVLSVMERDRRLTGSMYGQRDAVVAPRNFAVNSAWRLEKRAT
ncbi:hypothetical protein BZA05DRAFT_383494 [Tricharina praecox]|uniref:uncharacterized protein n=1 Tax=Tricharina praecox TaxID=43433 RepID=UPI00221E4A6A|nr:uncharacterized protein BZA05DRAFT_383494 [Tricharina praecox]KAI5859148.1 hypothetical protein BZA05DRAFT_383494 [Tricharina praecox]